MPTFSEADIMALVSPVFWPFLRVLAVLGEQAALNHGFRGFFGGFGAVGAGDEAGGEQLRAEQATEQQGEQSGHWALLEP